MATTVNSAFIEFNNNFVNLDIEKTKKARNSRDWLIEQLKKLPDKDDSFPKLYNERHIKFGSFARSTKIKPLDDIDLMLTFKGCGATYSKEELIENKYYIHTTDANDNLKSFAEDQNHLSSIKIVNKLVSSLNSIEHYKSADIHRRKEAATLKLSSYEWNFDIVPSFYTVNGFYLIPDGEGNWKASDPRIDQNRSTKINQKHDGKILQIIRTLKYWNRRVSMPTISSYLFENIILNFFEKETEVSKYIDYCIRDFWKHLKNGIYNSVPDPKGFQDDLNELEEFEQLNISIRADDTYTKTVEAINYETKEKNHHRSINKWRQIFGDEFPKYE